MSNIVVISDSHNRLPLTENFLRILDEADYIFHLGDGASDIAFLKDAYRSKFHYVYGNCDGINDCDYKIVVIEGVKFLLTHGHAFNVKSNLLNLSLFAQENDIDCVLFGHTHCPVIEDCHGLKLINPGSIGYQKNYCYMSICKSKVFAKLVKLI